MSVYSKLLLIQQELKAPKGQHNSFGNYNYRSCEDILEAVKPIAHKNGCVVTVTDDIDLIGERYYVRAIAILTECETGEQIQNRAFAREAAEKKGMDESQVTGTASSYARKYALNGLFAIDDAKDADTDEHRKQTAGKGQNKAGNQSGGNKGKLSDAQINRLMKIAQNSDKVTHDNVEGFVRAVVKQRFHKEDLKDMTRQEYDSVCNWLEGK